MDMIANRLAREASQQTRYNGHYAGATPHERTIMDKLNALTAESASQRRDLSALIRQSLFDLRKFDLVERQLSSLREKVDDLEVGMSLRVVSWLGGRTGRRRGNG
jgi:ABC-type transporter Mla subunit MlaD